jgi:hypothetical protein
MAYLIGILQKQLYTGEWRVYLMKKLIITIVILIVVVSITVAAFLAFQSPATNSVVTGVVAGNTFTYNLKASANVNEHNVTLPPAITEYNNTESFRVTITSVSGPTISFNTTWRFVNGTEINNSGYVNVLTGNDNQVFWAIYPANLSKNMLLNPQGTDGNIVNDTEVRTYKSGDRQTNIMTLQNQFPDSSNPTRVYEDYLYVHFDKITGMLVELQDIQRYNNPEAILTYSWILADSNVWIV